MKQIIFTILLTVHAIVAGAADAVTYGQMKQQLNEKSLPLVNITVDIASVTKPNYTQATIEIADPLARTDGNVVTTFNCKIKYRGATSLWYNKKSFAVKLLDADGNSLDAPVLGNREDDSWILGAMAIDRVRMRDRLCFDIWNEFSTTPYSTDFAGRNGTKGCFVEVFINGKYHGLYCMTDKVNRKLLGVKKAKTDDSGNPIINGVMYKCAEWCDAAYLNGYSSQSMTGESWNSWELDYPDDYPCETAYTPLKNFIDYCTTTSDDDFTSGLDENLYVQNMIDYHVFCLALGLRDNLMKNAFLSIVNINKGKRMMITPWALDTSIGGDWEGSYHNYVADNNKVLRVKPFGRLWNGNINKYQTAVADRWRKLSKTLLSKEAFNARVDAYVKQFKESGAWEREYNAWNADPVELKQNLDDETDYIKTWFSTNFDNLKDNLFANIPTEIVDETEFEAMTKQLGDNSLPLVNLTVDMDNVNKDEYSAASLEIADPTAKEQTETTEKYACKVKYRGTASLAYDKKSFAVKLLDESGKSLDATIFGIRKDDVWILDAMATDRSRLRNRLCTDLWNAVSKTPYDTEYGNRNGTEGQFVELFINGNYHGLYCFTDKINRKLLGIKKAKDNSDGTTTINGVLYKTDNWGEDTFTCATEDMPSTSTTWREWELDYPDDNACEDAWAPLVGFKDFCTTSSDEDFKAGTDGHMYAQNVTDYHVFALATGICNNKANDIYLSTVNANEGVQMLITPWSLGASLGADADGNYDATLSDNAMVTKMVLFKRLWEGKVNDYPYETAQRWKELYGSTLSTEAFNARVDAYAKAFAESGAWQREHDAWGKNAVELQDTPYTEAEYIKDWYKKNCENIDNAVLHGIESGIRGITTQPVSATGNTLYNVQGQRVSTAYKGIVISNGKKLLQR